MADPVKTPKAKGPLRSGALLAITVIVILFALYFKLLFDSNLRFALQWGATQVHGAEVNIGSLSTSFTNASLVIGKIQITDKDKPERNLVSIGRISANLLWDALLRAKFVVELAEAADIELYSPREKPGRILPPTENKFEEVENQVLDQAKEDFNENILGDVANVMGGTDVDSQLESIQTNLSSDVRVKELETELNTKKAAWEKRLKELPRPKKLDDLVAQAKKLKLDINNPSQFAKDLKEADRIYREGDQLIKNYEQTSKGLNQEIDGFNKSIKELEQLAKKDLNDLQKRLNLPKIDATSFTLGLFGKMFADKIASFRKYSTIAEDYMPKKKTASEEPEVSTTPARANGKSYHFPITKGYPLFWLKLARINSKPGQSEYSGDIAGELKHLTSHPVQLGIPTTLKLDGNFPKHKIYDFKSLATIDHTTEVGKETLVASVGSYPLEGLQLSNDEKAKVAMTSATGTTQINAISTQGKLNIRTKSQFSRAKFDVQSSSESTQKIISNILSRIPLVTLNAAATGSWSKINWNLNSNLGRELQRGFQKELQSQLNEAKKKLEDSIMKPVNENKAKLNAEFSKVKSQISSQLGVNKKEIDSARQQAKKSIDDKKGNTKKLEQEGKKALDDLKKSLGF